MTYLCHSLTKVIVEHSKHYFVKPILERIEKSIDSSFSIRKFDSSNLNEEPKWHIHPEHEIVYISEGNNGRRHIGQHISTYNNGDLLFLGPNIPHFGFTKNFEQDQFKIVVQLHEDFLGQAFLQAPEMKGVRLLFEKSKAGISFGGFTKLDIGRDLLDMLEMNTYDRLLRLLRIFQKMESSKEFEMLHVNALATEVNAKDQDRMKAIHAFVSKQYDQKINLEDVASAIQMTVPSFCRYFKRLTNKTFTGYVNEYRIHKACQLLSDSSKTITEICFESGFNNMSHFNKQFKILTGQTAGEYRKARNVVQS